MIFYSLKVERYLNHLVDILFEKEYFGFEENAVEYVQNLKDAAENKIRTENPKQTPLALLSYGAFYVSYKSNKRTTWSIFFSRKNNRILVKYITNNHVADAAFLNYF
jgi:hypothetical protein